MQVVQKPITHPAGVVSIEVLHQCRHIRPVLIPTGLSTDQHEAMVRIHRAQHCFDCGRLAYVLDVRETLAINNITLAPLYGRADEVAFAELVRLQAMLDVFNIMGNKRDTVAVALKDPQVHAELSQLASMTAAQWTTFSSTGVLPSSGVLTLQIEVDKAAV